MKKVLVSVVLVALLLSVFAGVKSAEPLFVGSTTNPHGSYEVPNEFIVGFRDGVNVTLKAKALENANSIKVKKVGLKNFAVFTLPQSKTLDAVKGLLLSDPDIAYVEPNYVAHAFSLPNDPYFSPYQWDLYDYGMLSNGYASNFGVQAVSAWNITRGAGVKVAIIDTGVAYENYTDPVTGTQYALAPDLANTKFDTANAYDFVNNDTHANDDNGHGTHVCGTIAQSTNNSIGCAGIAYEATILPIKVLDSSGSGTYDAIANGIIWAADHGARVINMSLGGSQGSTTLYNAIKYAYNKGVVIVCAAGNDGRPLVSYPAAYTECIAVGATRFDGRRAKYSNYGSALDIVAPGGDTSVDQNKDGYGDGILQQTFSGSPTNFGYYFFQGTSMATPHVAAVAALVLSLHPEFTNVQVRTALQSTAKDLGTKGWDKYYGYGLVNAYGAINWKP
ncbi:S8 family peptidase [Caldisericum exile]|uniref:S8 family peptidase n=1 Tax=Caldisericum exile (strain DSM 21853 / NBRC 104410 / AZM16c01) TaxID=511051 RepID=A0A7U6JG98_CALEA|nr:S8 family peptidase [Caldisericum exile]BAL81424.1 putative S8 family peptidase [Caldisericum exile AZM16c01]